MIDTGILSNNMKFPSITNVKRLYAALPYTMTTLHRPDFFITNLALVIELRLYRIIRGFHRTNVCACRQGVPNP